MSGYLDALGQLACDGAYSDWWHTDAVAWDDIGGLVGVKQRLKHAVEWPLRHKAAFERLNLSPPRGALLHGPPGAPHSSTGSGLHTVSTHTVRHSTAITTAHSAVVNAACPVA